MIEIHLRKYVLLAGLAAFLAFPTRAEDWEEEAEHGEEIEVSVPEIEAFLEEEMPEYAKALAAAKENNWSEYVDAVGRAGEMITNYRFLQREDPERAQIFLQIHQIESRFFSLADQWHLTSDPKEKSTLRGSIRELIDQKFELEQEIMKTELEDLKLMVKEIEEKLQAEAATREEDVEAAVEELLEEW